MKDKDLTKEELIIIWLNRFNRNSKQMAELIPDRTPKALKHVIGKMKKITDKDESFLIDQRLYKSVKDLDLLLGYPRGTASLYFRMKELDFLVRPESYSKKEIDTFLENKETITYQAIADLLEVSESRIRNMAHNLEMQTKFIWTKEKVADVVSRLEKGEQVESIAEFYGRKREAILVLLRKENLYEYIPKSYASKYTASRPEKVIMKRLSDEFGVNFPEKNRENAEYYWGIIPPYEVDIPFYINEHKFSIEYNAAYWHEGREAVDLIKKKLLEEKGFHHFIFSSDMHKHSNFNSMKSKLDEICLTINNILQS